MKLSVLGMFLRGFLESLIKKDLFAFKNEM